MGIGLFVGYIYTIFWISTSQIVALRDAPEKTGIMENLKRSRRLIWSFFLVGLILELVMMGGMVLLIVPGIMFMVWYGFAAFVMVTENKKGRLALAQSKAYVKGRSWKVFGRMLLVYLTIYVPYIVLQILGVVFKDNPAIYLPAVILAFFLIFFGTFYMMAFTYTLYRQLRDSAGPTDAQKYTRGITGWTIWGGIAFLILPIIILVRIIAVEPFVVSGKAMDPNFVNGQYLLLEKWDKNYQRDDVVILRYPKDPSQFFIKRIIGLPGETVTLQDGHVYINGQLLDESKYLPPSMQNQTFGDSTPVVLQANQYFVLGDNRTASSDSLGFGGFCQAILIVGKYWFTPFPANTKN